MIIKPIRSLPFFLSNYGHFMKPDYREYNKSNPKYFWSFGMCFLMLSIEYNEIMMKILVVVIMPVKAAHTVHGILFQALF